MLLILLMLLKSLKMRHAKLGHVNVASVNLLKQLFLIIDLSNTEWDKCQSMCRGQRAQENLLMNQYKGKHIC